MAKGQFACKAMLPCHLSDVQRLVSNAEASPTAQGTGICKYSMKWALRAS